MFYFFRKCSWCRDLGSSGSKNQHSLEEHFFHLATTNSILAPVRPARLQRWLPRRAKPSLHGSWRRTESKCHWSCNVTLTMRKCLPQHTPGSTAACTAQSLSGTVFDHDSWQLSPSWNSCAAAFAVEILTQICETQRTAWKNNFGTLPWHL